MHALVMGVSASLPQHYVLVMGVSAQSAGCLPYGLRSLWLALPRGGRKPHRGFLCPPSDSLP